jgi:hypothetical protein
MQVAILSYYLTPGPLPFHALGGPEGVGEGLGRGFFFWWK